MPSGPVAGAVRINRETGRAQRTTNGARGAPIELSRIRRERTHPFDYGWVHSRRMARTVGCALRAHPQRGRLGWAGQPDRAVLARLCQVDSAEAKRPRCARGTINWEMGSLGERGGQRTGREAKQPRPKASAARGTHPRSIGWVRSRWRYSDAFQDVRALFLLSSPVSQTPHLPVNRTARATGALGEST